MRFGGPHPRLLAGNYGRSESRFYRRAASPALLVGSQTGRRAFSFQARPDPRETIGGDKMSVKGEIKEGAGFVKEEMNEHGKSPESQRKAREGRDLRNEGRTEDRKAPKTTKPGTGHPEK